MPLFFAPQQEAETLINTSLGKLIKGKVFAFSSPSLNLGRDWAAGDGTASAFTVCLLCTCAVAGGSPSVLSQSTYPLMGVF